MKTYRVSGIIIMSTDFWTEVGAPDEEGAEQAAYEEAYRFVKKRLAGAAFDDFEISDVEEIPAS